MQIQPTLKNIECLQYSLNNTLTCVTEVTTIFHRTHEFYGFMCFDLSVITCESTIKEVPIFSRLPLIISIFCQLPHTDTQSQPNKIETVQS